MNLVDIIKKFLSGTPKNDDLAPDFPPSAGDPSYGPDGLGGSEPMKPPVPDGLDLDLETTLLRAIEAGVRVEIVPNGESRATRYKRGCHSIAVGSDLTSLSSRDALARVKFMICTALDSVPASDASQQPIPPAPLSWGDLVQQAKETANAASQPRPKTTHARSRQQPQTRQKDGSARKGR